MVKAVGKAEAVTYRKVIIYRVRMLASLLEVPLSSPRVPEKDKFTRFERSHPYPLGIGLSFFEFSVLL